MAATRAILEDRRGGHFDAAPSATVFKVEFTVSDVHGGYQVSAPAGFEPAAFCSGDGFNPVSAVRRKLSASAGVRGFVPLKCVFYIR